MSAAGERTSQKQKTASAIAELRRETDCKLQDLWQPRRLKWEEEATAEVSGTF